MADETPKPEGIPIDWRTPESTVSRYATNLVIQRTENEYVLSFFEVLPPIILGETQKKLDSVTAECVARIIVAAGKMPDFVNVLQEHLRKTLESRQETQE